MVASRCLLMLFVTSITYAALPRPSYMKPCARNDPNFNKCALEHAKDVIPHLVKGDRKYGIPNMDPIEIPEIIAPSGTFTLSLKNVKMNGLKNIDLKKIECDFKNYEFRLDMVFPRLEVISNYEINGKILLLAITGNGLMNVKLDNPEIKTNFEGKIVEMDGAKYLEITKGNTQIEPQQVHYHLENLFNGNKLLGDEMNQLLNKEWKDAWKEISPPMIEAVNKIILNIIAEFTKRVPFDELFPEKV